MNSLDDAVWVICLNYKQNVSTWKKIQIKLDVIKCEILVQEIVKFLRLVTETWINNYDAKIQNYKENWSEVVLSQNICLFAAPTRKPTLYTIHTRTSRKRTEPNQQDYVVNDTTLHQLYTHCFPEWLNLHKRCQKQRKIRQQY